MKDTAKKVCCLIHDSVYYGASVYRHLLGEQDVEGRVFTSDIQMLPTEQEQAILQAMMNEIIQTNPEFVVYCDTFKVMRIAKEDVKLAEKYFRQCQKKMIQAQKEQAAQNTQLAAQQQQQSNQQAAENEMQIEQMKAQFESQKNGDLSRAKKEELALQGYFDCKKAGVSLDPALENEIVQNVLIPLFAENQKNKVALAQGMQDMQQSDQGQQAPPEDQQEPAETDQPQQTMQQ